ncbi:MAG: L,D-transpeptidase family protein [Aliarcobacter sp.]|nr:L,D-transpeptidase family protein [Aliarcobacter sp.]
MFRFIIFLLLALNMYAADLVTLYRYEGINSVEKEIENKLKDATYWQEYLKDKNVDFGYYEFKKYVLVTQKNQSEIAVYQKVDNDYKLVSKSSVIVGENKGDKYTEGDKKTPEGAYELVQKRVGLDSFYGPFALVTSYPNIFDQSLDKKGSGIWIHGMPLYSDRENFTKGCIALNNSELETLEKSIDLNKSVLLTYGNDFKKVTKDEIALVLSSIYKWKDAWKTSDIDGYLSFYSNNFKRSNKTDFILFKEQKKSVFAKKEQKSIKFINIDLSPYPNSLGKNMFKVLMDEEYTSPSVKFNGKKELFLEIANNQVKILSED